MGVVESSCRCVKEGGGEGVVEEGRGKRIEEGGGGRMWF